MPRDGEEHTSRPAGGGAAGAASVHVRKLLMSGASRGSLLTQLASAGEALAGNGAVVSILVLNDQGELRNGASPNLPADYLSAIDRLKPNARVGTCAAAAATGHPVITPDFCADDKWAELKHLPMALGFVGAWSQPIKTASGVVLGTFGTYYREHRQPSAEERRGVEVLADAAAVVLTGEG